MKVRLRRTGFLVRNTVRRSDRHILEARTIEIVIGLPADFEGTVG